MLVAALDDEDIRVAPLAVALLTPRVRRCVIEALGKTRLKPSEARAIKALLTRSAADIRRSALTLLASLPPDAAHASADRLAASPDKGQRDAATDPAGPGLLAIGLG